VVINGSNKDTNEVAAGSAGGAEDAQSTTLVSNFGDVGARGKLISGKSKAKEGKGAGISHGLIRLIEKGGVAESKGSGSEIRGFGGEGSTILDPLKVLDVWRDKGCRKIIHCLIEACVERNFDPFRL
jgi:hypothetical protein